MKRKWPCWSREYRVVVCFGQQRNYVTRSARLTGSETLAWASDQACEALKLAELMLGYASHSDRLGRRCLGGQRQLSPLGTFARLLAGSVTAQQNRLVSDAGA
jgi:hypothetical protein